MKRLLAMWLCAVMTLGSAPMTSRAALQWPSDVTVEADGAILMDASTGTVLYEKNSKETYYPASITKILTALVVIENCDDLDETVTFSYNAIFNVEERSSNMGAQVGDQLSVRDCLYGLMLVSANEAANALAEHVAGSTEEFVKMMNKKATELGCTGSHFANPNGLNNEDHYTTAYDMALITRAAIQNETFLEIDGSTSWTHGPIKRYPDPAAPENTMYTHHRMLRKATSVYYPGAFAGKTGYTSLAGNTLVTCAEQNGMTLIAVILNGHQTHYTDTKKLLDFGFENFQSTKIADYDSSFHALKNHLTIAGLPATRLSDIVLNPDATILLPKKSNVSDVASQISYDLTDQDPPMAIAKLYYSYDSRPVGSAYLINMAPDTTEEDLEEMALPAIQDFPDAADVSQEESLSPGEPEEKPAPKRRWLPQVRINVPRWILVVGGIVAVLVVAGFTAAYLIESSHQRELVRRERLRDKRKARLSELGFTSEDFNLMMEQKHLHGSHPEINTSPRPIAHTSRKRRRTKHK